MIFEMLRVQHCSRTSSKTIDGARSRKRKKTAPTNVFADSEIREARTNVGGMLIMMPKKDTNLFLWGGVLHNFVKSFPTKETPNTNPDDSGNAICLLESQ